MKYKTREEKQEQINNNTRLIAYKIFSNKGDFKFADAYDKLKARVLLDWDINISDRLKGSTRNKLSMFKVLSNEEINMVLESSKRLLKMYEEVIERKIA